MRKKLYAIATDMNEPLHSAVFFFTVCCCFSAALMSDIALGSMSEQTDHIIQNLLTNYKVEVHPETEDDGAVNVKVSVVPLHLEVVRIKDKSFECRRRFLIFHLLTKIDNLKFRTFTWSESLIGLTGGSLDNKVSSKKNN